MAKKLASILIILLFFAVEGDVHAQIEVKQEKVNPDSGFSFLTKRLNEKFVLFISSPFPEKKESALENVAGKRLAELKYVVEKPDPANFEKATIRYSTAIGQWVEYINKKNLVDQKQHAAEVLNMHIPVVTTLMSKYDDTTAEWRFVKHDLDYLDIYISNLK